MVNCSSLLGECRVEWLSLDRYNDEMRVVDMDHQDWREL